MRQKLMEVNRAYNEHSQEEMLKTYVESKTLIQSIHKVYDGEPIVSPTVTVKLLQQLSQPAPIKGTCGLRDRELEILLYVVRGSSNREIGNALYISEKTVKNHLSSIFRKLAVEDRT